MSKEQAIEVILRKLYKRVDYGDIVNKDTWTVSYNDLEQALSEMYDECQKAKEAFTSTDAWIWMPHPAHLCVSDKCKFFLATTDGEYIVSTVGEYFQNENDKKPTTVGLNRLYETMVFKAKKSDNRCCPFVQASGEHLDAEGYNDPKDAREGHYKLCKKWLKKPLEQAKQEAKAEFEKELRTFDAYDSGMRNTIAEVLKIVDDEVGYVEFECGKMHKTVDEKKLKQRIREIASPD